MIIKDENCNQLMMVFIRHRVKDLA